jgi:hypothetical protein
MATSTEKRPPPLSSGDRTGNKAGDTSKNMIAYVIAAIIAVMGGYYLYSTYYAPTSTTSAVTDGTASKPVTPVPATPPAATAPKPVVPATPPATTTTP